MDPFNGVIYTLTLYMYKSYKLLLHISLFQSIADLLMWIHFFRPNSSSKLVIYADVSPCAPSTTFECVIVRGIYSLCSSREKPPTHFGQQLQWIVLLHSKPFINRGVMPNINGLFRNANIRVAEEGPIEKVCTEIPWNGYFEFPNSFFAQQFHFQWAFTSCLRRPGTVTSYFRCDQNCLVTEDEGGNGKH